MEIGQTLVNEYVIPTTPEGLDSVNCTYNSPCGAIVSNWKKTASGSYTYEITIPHGTKANVSLSVSRSQKVRIINEQELNESSRIRGLQTGNFSLQEGNYVITVTSEGE